MTESVQLELRPTGSGDTCRRILSELPEWFGIPESNQDYIDKADSNPTVVAIDNEAEVGLLTIVQHSDAAAEVYLMAVARAHHRAGVGTAMLDFTEHHLATAGVRFLQVKTLGPGREDPEYAKTRAFYQSSGFVELETFPDLWDPVNPALQMIKYLPQR